LCYFLIPSRQILEDNHDSEEWSVRNVTISFVYFTVEANDIWPILLKSVAKDTNSGI